MIRKWLPCDTRAVAEIEAQSFSDPWSENMLSESLASPCFEGYVFEREGEILGYVGAVYSFDAEIALIAVKADCRRRGIGRALLSKALEGAYMKGCEYCYLEVRPSNSPALKLYTGMGFAPCGMREKYYADGEDAYILRLNLQKRV